MDGWVTWHGWPWQHEFQPSLRPYAFVMLFFGNNANNPKICAAKYAQNLFHVYCLIVVGWLSVGLFVVIPPRHAMKDDKSAEMCGEIFSATYPN